jgi:hypothetical protein
LAQPALAFGAVQLDHRLVNADLVGRRPTDNGVSDLFVDRLDRAQNALTTIAFLSPSLLPRLMDAG